MRRCGGQKCTCYGVNPSARFVHALCSQHWWQCPPVAHVRMPIASSGCSLACCSDQDHRSGRVTDAGGEEVSLYKWCDELLHELHTKKKYVAVVRPARAVQHLLTCWRSRWAGTKVGYASRTNYPEYAYECMSLIGTLPLCCRRRRVFAAAAVAAALSSAVADCCLRLRRAQRRDDGRCY